MHVPRPPVLRAVAAAALVVAAGLIAAPPASAHNVLVSTVPVAGATVTALPTEVVLSFEEAPLPGGTAIVVRDPDGTLVTAGKASIDGAQASVELQPLTLPGTYGVSYRSASDDGHTITGSFTFVVPASLLPDATPIASPSGSETPSAPIASPSSSSTQTSSTGEASSMNAWPLLLGGLVVVVVVGIVVLLRRRSA